MHRLKGVIEHEVAHISTLGDTPGLIEMPVDTQVDAALAVLFLGTGESLEQVSDQRAPSSSVARRRRHYRWEGWTVVYCHPI